MKKEEFFDEQILDMINQSEQKSFDNAGASGKEDKNDENKIPEERSIYTGVRICGKWIYFERQLFAGDSISMMVPKNFVPMTQEAAKIKYPSEHRPETILTDETGTINLMFQYMEGEVDSETIETFRNQVFGLMKYANPGIKEREVGEVDIEGHHIAYVEFTNNALGGKLYNLMFYISIKGRPLMGSFNCITKDVKYWQPVAVEMMKSIEIMEDKKEM
jgi:hypothetical protein